ncbi:MAG: NVEALA domain-containing protein [Bacteroidales bacterium]|nr:NVEALA domain-containing protein [Bacteroidales bacterium]
MKKSKILKIGFALVVAYISVQCYMLNHTQKSGEQVLDNIEALAQSESEKVCVTGPGMCTGDNGSWIAGLTMW